MTMLILSLHVLIASIMTFATIGVFAAAYNRRETKAYTVMLASFVVTIVGGVGLLFVSAGGLGRFCAMMSAFTLMTIVARQYYRKQLKISQTL